MELDKAAHTITIRAELVLYGNAATAALAAALAADVAQHWNEPNAAVSIHDAWYDVRFEINGFYNPALPALAVYENVDPRKNYFRIEKFARGNISFVDGINSNTGYFKLENLLNNSTTAAHEFGHTLGLHHPADLDIRGKGVPGIMYPRGTITDPAYQYDPHAAPGQTGGTMNPLTRKVRLCDIADLALWSVHYGENGKGILGDFTSVWHEAHEDEDRS